MGLLTVAAILKKKKNSDNNKATLFCLEHEVKCMSFEHGS